MPLITFFDTEINPKDGKIADAGGIKPDGSSFHSTSVAELGSFLKGSEYICGHNIINHDLKFISKYPGCEDIMNMKAIDTLYLSPLLFPKKEYHKLVKDDKLDPENHSNPLNDSLKAKALFYDEIAAFQDTDEPLKVIYYRLLAAHQCFENFFRYCNYTSEINNEQLEALIHDHFHGKICSEAELRFFIREKPVELAYCLALIHCGDRFSITPRWVLHTFPDVERVMHLLRANPCITTCEFCNQAFNAKENLRSFFGFQDFRSYDGEPLQEKSVNAAIQNKSLLAVFPTGGGKSLTFQLPALMAGKYSNALTIVISPLQSLMKDQVDNLEKVGISEVVTINGMLDPIERSKSIERVRDGSASILYISPESLRSKTIENLLLGRRISRFVIDEAHCFSAWGHDFRVDYLYIAEFIKKLQKDKNLAFSIPVSCFTATAKIKVIEDICAYFREKLGLELSVFKSDAGRTNLKYEVIFTNDEENKYLSLRRLLEEKDCPVIVYSSRTSKTNTLAKRLSDDGYRAAGYHGKMDVKEKTRNQEDFIKGDIRIMVATSAFGMGVDKSDVGMVVHYDISDSLENYVQEAGRAGRDENISADCYVLYNEDDLMKHFILLNQTRLNIKEIQQIWRAVKEMMKGRLKASNSALEFARKAGWDESVRELETRVKTAISALEEAGYLKRTHNSPQLFATSILVKNADEAIQKINASAKFTEKDKVHAIRIMKKLISSKSRKQASEEDPETRIDYISDDLGIHQGKVIKIVNLLVSEKILSDTRDLTAFINRTTSQNSSEKILISFTKLEQFLFEQIHEVPETINVKALNEEAVVQNCPDVNPSRIKTIFNFWSVKQWIRKENKDIARNHISIHFRHDKKYIQKKIEKRHVLSGFIIELLYQKSYEGKLPDESTKEILVEFSVHEIKDRYLQNPGLFKINIEIEDVEDALLFLSRIGAINIEGGFMVIYNKLNLERTEINNKIQYKKEDYKKLEDFYLNKIQQIHIVGEYANKLLSDYTSALTFVDDYFNLNYYSFLEKYFPGKDRKDQLNKSLTPAKFKQIFGELSPSQLEIIKDSESPNIVVAAGPGSGKTRILVHKLASLIMMEEIKTEQLLMLTFSRAAATEFKIRLRELIGNIANYIEIKTFHSFCFDLLGQSGNLEKSKDIIISTLESITKGEVERSRITRHVLVIDEAQDMDENEFKLVESLMETNEEMRLIAVGDDDQNIYTFRGADSKYLRNFIIEKKARKYELSLNFRSKANIVDFSNQFVKSIKVRLKDQPIISNKNEVGEIRLTKYKSGNLIVPLVNDVLKKELSGTTCILTTKNDEALQITGLLLNHSRPARLIRSNDGFKLTHLFELREFVDEIERLNTTPKISEDSWEKAMADFNERFKSTRNYDSCLRLLKKVESVYGKDKYLTDLKLFILESGFEDFIEQENESIIVSTIHKAKGKEYDNIFLLLNNFELNSDEKKRQVYVALTRAKNNLYIHHNIVFAESIQTANLERIDDKLDYPAPPELTVQMSHKDVQLGYFSYIQHHLRELRSGDALISNPEGFTNQGGQMVLKFSSHFKEQLEKLRNDGYHIKSALVNFIVYWKDDKTDSEVKIVLGEVCFGKVEGV